MKERPILFNTSMVKAILEGRKTQTRRLVNSELIIQQAEFECGNRPNVLRSEPNLQYWIDNQCPYGQVGDQLWVRETWRKTEISECGCEDNCSCSFGGYDYLASSVDTDVKWKPSIHMPRKASRIQLEITNIRVERLNDISESDCLKEGIGSPILRDCKKPKFMQLWESINGGGSWSRNPWVWVVEYKIIQGGKHE
ncbi:hypothetical protein V6760_03930 [Acinetobacter venetianus]